MQELDRDYPGYGFAQHKVCKGGGSSDAGAAAGRDQATQESKRGRRGNGGSGGPVAVDKAGAKARGAPGRSGRARASAAGGAARPPFSGACAGAQAGARPCM